MNASEKSRILVVDDERDITAVLKMVLEKSGDYLVDTFNDPREAISHFKPAFYDFIVLDIRMPAVSGFELAREIWKNDPEAQICFFTAFEIYENESHKVFPSIHEHCFIKKPISPSELIKHIQTHMHKKIQ